MKEELKNLIEIQEEFSKEFRNILLCDEMFDRALDFVSKIHKKSTEYEKERIKKIIKDMPDTFPELESDCYDTAYKDAKRYMLEVIDITS